MSNGKGGAVENTAMTLSGDGSITTSTLDSNCLYIDNNDNNAISINGNATINGSLTVNGTTYSNGAPDEPEEDLFKKIATLLGIKIINVSIKNGKVILYGRRVRKNFVIEVDSSRLIVRNDKGKVLTTISLYNTEATSDEYTYVYPDPAPINPWITSDPAPNPWGTTWCDSGKCSDSYTNFTIDSYIDKENLLAESSWEDIQMLKGKKT